MNSSVVVDTSAFVAILLGEPEQETFLKTLTSCAEIWVSAATAVETAIVLAAKRGAKGLSSWAALQRQLGVEVVPLTQQHVLIATDAWLRFGKGHHAAALNICDCYSYATARFAELPLLFKGNDFRQTDVIAAEP